jgi:triosephosphate isomerase (TIM)
MRKPLIAGNWKMYKTHLEAIHLVEALGHELAEHDFDRIEVALCPPHTALRSVQTVIEDRRYSFLLGAQNVFYEKEGAFTGEVSAGMLAAMRVRYAIVGHSERREVFGESDEDVNRKVKALGGAGITPILCCGETDLEREGGETEAKVERQVKAGFAGVKLERAGDVVIAYEPIWAIGTGKTATPDDAQETISFIRAIVGKVYDEETARRMRILYGGSVKSGNAAALIRQEDIDGALVGGASLDAAEFAAIVKAAA